MGLSRTLLVAGLLALGATTTRAASTTYVFRGAKTHSDTLGFIDTGIDEWGFGILVFEGYRFRTTGFDSWEFTWMAQHDGAHMCLIIHPTQPWIVGFVIWWGDWGVFDILSTDGVRFEGEVSVQCLVEDPRNDAH